RAPDFDLPIARILGDQRQRAALADYHDRWLILMFYPRDFSLVCPTELTALSLRYDEFVKRDCDLLAISTDSVETHERWMITHRSQGGLGGCASRWPLTRRVRFAGLTVCTSRGNIWRCGGCSSSIPTVCSNIKWFTTSALAATVTKFSACSMDYRRAVYVLK